MIRVNSFFSGAGLMDLGLSLGGLTIQRSFEIDAVCCETLRRNFSHEVVPDSFEFAGSDRDAYRMIGNGVSVPVGEWVAGEVLRYFGRAA